MFSKLLTAVLIFAFANSNAQTPTAVAAKPVSVSTSPSHVANSTSPSIKNLSAAPKEVNKKKRKPEHITIAKSTPPASTKAVK